jgi:hypothetical protein
MLLPNRHYYSCSYYCCSNTFFCPPSRSSLSSRFLAVYICAPIVQYKYFPYIFFGVCCACSSEVEICVYGLGFSSSLHGTCRKYNQFYFVFFFEKKGRRYFIKFCPLPIMASPPAHCPQMKIDEVSPSIRHSSEFLHSNVT